MTTVWVIPFLPLRPAITDARDEGKRLMNVIVESAAMDDAELVRQVAKFESDKQMQQLLADKWQALLTRLRANLTTARTKRPPLGNPSWLGETDKRYGAALLAADGTDEFKQILDEARAYSAEREEVVPAKANRAAQSPVAEEDDAEFERMRATRVQTHS